MININRIRQKGAGSLKQSGRGESLTPIYRNINSIPREKIKMSLFDRVQVYLTGDSDIHQKFFAGQHKINIQIPDVNAVWSQDEVDNLAAIACNSEESQKVASFIAKCVANEVGRLCKNTANAEKTRSVKPSTTANKGWKSYIENEDYPNARVMFDAMVLTQVPMGYTDRQIADLREELLTITPDSDPNDEDTDES